MIKEYLYQKKGEPGSAAKLYYPGEE